jgi:hypothetical protein
MKDLDLVLARGQAKVAINTVKIQIQHYRTDTSGCGFPSRNRPLELIRIVPKGVRKRNRRSRVHWHALLHLEHVPILSAEQNQHEFNLTHLSSQALFWRYYGTAANTQSRVS